MGIRGLQTFIEEKLGILEPIELHHCNVLLDGNSIYHQMYIQCHLTCLFGGEYDKFYRYCKQLFESFAICRINAIVVFDGARLDNRKLSTVLERSQKRVDYSTRTSVNINLSPLLLRQTFIGVLDDMNVPYVSALGEGDEECVSLANHLDCYLIARDSDYYCFDLVKGYLQFDYIDINPIEKDSYHYLSAQLFRINALLEKFPGLNSSTLSLACCLCGNDYINITTTEPIFGNITASVDKSTENKISKSNRTKHWYAMQWMKQFNDVDTAISKLLIPIAKTSRANVEKKLRLALQSYVNPKDTLIYRFEWATNENIRKNPYLVQLAREYIDTLDMTDEQIHQCIKNSLSEIQTREKKPMPKLLLNYLSNTRLSFIFIEVLIHRYFICSAHIEIENEPSIYVDAIPIILRCLASLLRWDSDGFDETVMIYHRLLKKLKPRTYDFSEISDIPDFNNFNALTLDERQDFVFRCLKFSSSQREEFNHIHSDYHFWLICLRYWYTIRDLKPVYLCAIILSLIKSTHLFDSDTFQSDDIEPLSISINDDRNHTQIEPETRRSISSKLKAMTKKVYDMKRFDCSIIHEFNCLQTIYMFSIYVNEFFNQPLNYKIHPQKFLCGSFFYAFVEHYETKRNLSAAINSLFQNDIKLMNIINTLFMAITSDIF